MGDTKDGRQEQVQPFRLISNGLLKQRGHLVGWVPVFLGIGIGLYFGLRAEPSYVVWIGVTALVLLALFLSRAVGYACAPILVALALAGTGAGLAKVRTELVRAPVLDFRYFGPIQGRVVNIDRSASDAVRLTLDRVILFNLGPAKTPQVIRVSVHGDQPLADYNVGDTLITTGHLGPPSGPAEPGGFDFQRHAWFLGLGAVGYTRNPVLRLSSASFEADVAVVTIRQKITRHVLGAMPADTAGFAVAITTGDRSAIPSATLDDLRAANLAHLLAISGLHMGLLTGFVFLLVRSVFALHPKAGLEWPTKKIAAAAAILCGAAYLALSGGNVATERAFIMVTVMFVAVILDRRAVTLRAVAIAATIVLLLRPEALTGPGFQMSFAATTALVFVFGLLRDIDMYEYPRWARGAFSVVVSSGVAGLATAPFAAAHFNQIAHFGFIANVISAPIMGALVMPSAVVAAILAPFGLDGIGFLGMDIGLRWILFVAETTAHQPGAVGHVVAPDKWVLPLIAMGLLIFVLWQGRSRSLGLAVVIAGFVLWSQTHRPALLIAESGGFMGLNTQSGRDLSRATGHGFVSAIWLENDGAPVPQGVAAERDGIEVGNRTYEASIENWRVLMVSGKTALSELEDCGGADVLLSNQIITTPRSCLYFDQAILQNSGALSMNVIDATLRIQSARSKSGVRPWNAYAYDVPMHASWVLQKENGLTEQPLLAER